ncbi:MAG: hypothetical protein FJ128_08440 [Deltaproteobacteria bacterium]|nr:hypothetical protein [Deltaproteobacteria bacterium]
MEWLSLPLVAVAGGMVGFLLLVFCLLAWRESHPPALVWYGDLRPPKEEVRWSAPTPEAVPRPPGDLPETDAPLLWEAPPVSAPPGFTPEARGFS